MNDEMTNYLSSLYGTPNASQGDDEAEYLEKVASLEVLGQYADALDIDLSDVDFDQYSSDEIKDAINELGAEYEKTASHGGLPEEFNQYDTAGRVMAHAFWQENARLQDEYELSLIHI